MKALVARIGLLLILAVIVQLFIQQSLLISSRSYTRFEKLYNVENTINSELLLDYNQLSSRERICQLAKENLLMVYPTLSTTKPDSSQVICVGQIKDDKKNSFSLLDTFNPSAEALTSTTDRGSID